MNNGPFYKRTFFYSLVSKFCIGGFYITLLIFFLSLPKLTSFWQKEDSINVYLFAEMVSTQAISEFQKKTGIKVNVSYFELDEELFAKFRINQGEGYDVVIVTDYLVRHLTQENYLHKIDTSKLVHYKEIDNRLLGLYFDSAGHWSIPGVWFSYGLVYDTRFFAHTPSWETIYTSPHELVRQGVVPRPFRVCMLNEPRDLVEATRIYLFGKPNGYSRMQLDAIRKLLIKQKSWVESYTTSSLEYFLISGVVPIAMTSSNYAKRIIELDDKFGFVIPKEGSATVIESFVIPQKSTKKDLAYKFIDYMISPEAGKMHNDDFAYNPVNTKSYDLLDPKDLENKHIFPDQEMFKRLYIAENKTPKSMIEEVWVALGVA